MRNGGINVNVAGIYNSNVSIYQQPAPAPTLSLSPSSGTVAGASGATITTSVTTNVADGWTVSSSTSWISTSLSTGPTGTTTVAFTATSANTTGRVRSGIVYFRAANVTVIYTLAQLAAQTLSVSPSSGAVGAGVGYSVVTSVTTSVPSGWTLSGLPSWASASTTTGRTGTTSFRLTTTEANTATTARSAIITIEATGAESVTYTLAQAGATPTLAFYRTSGVVAASAGSTVTTSVTTDAVDGWTLSGLPDWATASSTTGPTGTINITFTATSDNPLTTTRTARITITATGATAATYNLTQVERRSQNPVVWLTPSAVVVADSGDTVSATVHTTKSSWTATTNADWLTIDVASGVNGSTLSVVVAPNTISNVRNAMISLHAEGTNTNALVIYQQPAPFPTLSVSPTSGTVTATTGSTVTTAVTTTVPSGWTLSGVPAWATASRATGPTGTTEVTFTTTSANTSGTVRTGTVTITAAGGRSTTYTLTQLVTALTLSVSPTSGTVAATTGSTVTPSVTTNVADGWTLTGLPAWARASRTTGATGTANVTFTAASANTTTASRSATITITAPGATSVTYNLTQAGATASLSISPSSGTAAATTGSTTTTAVTTTVADGWTLSGVPDWATASRTTGPNGTTEVTFTTASANTTTATRSATITITAPGATSVTYNLTQAGATATLSVAPTSGTVAETTGSTATTTVTTNVASGWALYGVPDWASASRTTGPAGTTDVRFTTAQTNTRASRSATIIITAPGATSVTYTLTQAGPPAPTGCGASIATTCQIVSGSTGQFTGQLGTGSQQDWIRFTPTVTGIYIIHSTTIPVYHDVYGYLYNSAGTTLTSNDDAGGNLDFLITYNLTAGQTYYIGIRNYNTTTTQPTYTITVDRPTTAPTLTVWPVGGTLTATTGSTVTMSVTTTVASGWTLVGVPHWASASRTSGPSGTTAVTFTTTVANTSTTPRFAGLTISASGMASVTYTLTQAGAPPLPVCTTSTATTCQIPSGITGQFTGQLATGAQQDWIRFTPSLTGTYTIRSSTTPVSHDVFGYLYNATGATLLTNDDSAGNYDFLITYDLTAGQTYYIGIRNYTNTTSTQPTYTITVQRVYGHVGTSEPDS